jgi:hypothetical protein
MQRSDTGVSVVVPARRPELASAAVASALSQTVGDIEVIVVYDGAVADEEYARLKSLLDSEVRLIATGMKSNANCARNLGIAVATKDYIALLDDDDVWLPDKLDCQLKEAPAVGTLWVSTTQVQTFGGERNQVWPAVPPPPDGLDRYLLGRSEIGAKPNFLQTSTWLAPAGVFKDNQFDESRTIHQDLDWLVRVQHDRCLKLVHVQRPLTRYRESTVGSVSRTSPWTESFRWICDLTLPADPRARGDFLLVNVLPKAVLQGRLKNAWTIWIAANRTYEAGFSAKVFAWSWLVRYLLRRMRLRSK